MTTMSISMPEAMRKFVDARVKKGSYGTSSEYIRALIRADQDREQKLTDLRREVQIGIDQVERGEFSTRSIDEIKREARRRAAARKRA